MKHDKLHLNMKHDKQEKLYRKVNTTARGVHHHKGGDAKYDRNTKKGISAKMKNNDRRGLDFTPLYRYLQSKVGQNFDIVYSAAVKRLDNDEAIWYIVDNEKKSEYMYNEKAIFSKLYVDENNILQFINPNLKNEDFAPSCPCCTTTFNGKPLLRKYSTETPENITRS